VVLAAANTYTGVTTVAEGTLRLGASDRIADTGALRLTGGTFDSAGHSDTLGTLDVDGTAVIDLGSGSSTLRFADSAVQTWSGTLTLRNGSGGGTGRLFIGTTSGGASAQQLDRIMFPNGRKAIQLATGEVVPVPQGTLIRFN
jgi:autotransporter-associated beta strand protein